MNIDGPISNKYHGYIAVLLLLIGFTFLGIFVSLSPSKNSSLFIFILQVIIAALSSISLGFGTAFSFLAGGVYL